MKKCQVVEPDPDLTTAAGKSDGRKTNKQKNMLNI